MLKDHAEYERDTSSAKFTVTSRQVTPASLPGVSTDYCQRALVDEIGIIRTQIVKAQ
jgi:hypothetical protein